MSLTSFTADKNTDSCLEVIALGQSPLIAIRIESITDISTSWKTKDVKNSASGVLAVKKDNILINPEDASFALDVSQETPLALCFQDQGAITDAKNRIRVIFYHQDASRAYSIVKR